MQADVAFANLRYTPLQNCSQPRTAVPDREPTSSEKVKIVALEKMDNLKRGDRVQQYQVERTTDVLMMDLNCIEREPTVFRQVPEERMQISK